MSFNFHRSELSLNLARVRSWYQPVLALNYGAVSSSDITKLRRTLLHRTRERRLYKVINVVLCNNNNVKQLNTYTRPKQNGMHRNMTMPLKANFNYIFSKKLFLIFQNLFSTYSLFNYDTLELIVYNTSSKLYILIALFSIGA